MNWKLIAIYSAALMVAGIVIGLVGAGASATDPVNGLSGYLMLLGIYMAIFMRMSTRQKERPFLHGALAITLASVVSFMLLFALNAPISFTSLLLELIVSIFALVAGIHLGRRAGSRSRSDA